MRYPFTHARNIWAFIITLLVVGLLPAGMAHSSDNMGTVVGAETPVCPTFGPAPGNQDGVEIAAGPSGYLAVWADTRGSSDSDIFGCRLGPRGEIIDTLGISICSYSNKQLDPDIAWNGNEYLVVWADRRGALQHIYAARVRPTGEVLDPNGILISGTNGGQSSPKVAGEPGGGWLVVWQDSKGTSADIYGCKINGDGTINKIYGITTRSDNEETPDVAFNGTTYFVVWRDYRNSAASDTDIYGCRVSKLGVRTGSDLLISCLSDGTTGAPQAQLNPHICAFTNACMVVWEDSRNNNGVQKDIYGARVSNTGSLYDKGGIAISTASGNKEFPCVAYDGNLMLVVWRDSSRLVKGARVNNQGKVADTNGIAISSGMAGSSGIEVVGGSQTFVVGWSSFSVTNSDAITTTVSDAGVVSNKAGATVSMALDNELDYAVADNGSEYAVVWSQIVNGNHDILAARVSHQGEPLDQVPVNLTSTIVGEQVQPSIAWNGTKYLVVWCGNETFNDTDWDIRGCFLDSSLNHTGTTHFDICANTNDQLTPYVASNGSGFLVVWENKASNVPPYYFTDICGAIVASSGAITSLSTAISGAAGNQVKPRAASSGTDYLVVWEDYRNGDYPGYPLIYGCKVTSTAQVKNPDGIAFPLTTSNQTTPYVCFGGGNYLVTWADYYNITGCRVSTAGVVLDSQGITIDSGTKLKANPTSCWDGSGFRVVWEDYRSSDSANSDIYYSTVSQTGVVPSNPKTALVSSLIPQLRPRIFMSSRSGVLLYSRFHNHSNCACVVTLTDQDVQEIDSVADAKMLPAGTVVALTDKVVTAAFTGFYYIEDLDRSSGIKVVSSVPATMDTLMSIIGTISVQDGERQINCSESLAMGFAADPPAPLGMRGDFMGGAALNSETPGITGATGPNNIGLLVKTWGKVKSTSTKSFYIESKPGTLILVNCGYMTKPAVGKMVSVTGICSCEIVSGTIGRAILPRMQSDIVVLN